MNNWGHSWSLHVAALLYLQFQKLLLNWTQLPLGCSKETSLQSTFLSHLWRPFIFTELYLGPENTGTHGPGSHAKLTLLDVVYETGGKQFGGRGATVHAPWRWCPADELLGRLTESMLPNLHWCQWTHSKNFLSRLSYFSGKEAECNLSKTSLSSKTTVIFK